MAFAPVGPDGAALRALRRAGLRVTAPCLATLSCPAKHPHPTAERPGTREQPSTPERLSTVSAQAVYGLLAARVLAARVLAARVAGARGAAGLVHRTEPQPNQEG